MTHNNHPKFLIGNIKLYSQNNPYRICYQISYYNYLWKYKPNLDEDIYNVISCINISKEGAVHSLLSTNVMDDNIYFNNFKMTLRHFIMNFEPNLISIIKKEEYDETNFNQFKFNKYPPIIIKNVGEKLEKMDIQLQNENLQELFCA